ncbi:MAG: peptidoglycan DD-metalloendopeptidase family protein [Myxococcales bacterium]|nr:peptidoglycan DD-metalloendopeptidase family protein [Myxococcales bacterium]
MSLRFPRLLLTLPLLLVLIAGASPAVADTTGGAQFGAASQAPVQSPTPDPTVNPGGIDPSQPLPSAPVTPVPAPLAGDVAHVTRLLARGATPSELEEVEGAVFRNLLWPVRGGRPPVVEGRGVNIPADEGDAVRVVADGLVLYVGEGLRGLGRAVVVLHRNGWVSLYGSNAETHVEVGQQVRRGEWIARVGMSGGGAPHLHFQLRDAGEVVDPIPLFVQTPH